jgi:SAM-dependent methyltransferase
VWANFRFVAEEYERGRPGWPDEAVDALELDVSSTVLDLAAGTGKLTRALVGRVARVVAVEPHAELRARIPREAEAVEGTAQAIPLSDSSVDAVVCGDAFHWFAEPTAVAEIARVLRPGGTLGLLWHRPAGDHEPPIPDEAFLPDVSTISSYDSGEWREAFAGSPFGPFEERRFPQVHELDREGVVAWIGSFSSTAARPPDERAAHLARVRELLDADLYRLPLSVHVQRARRAA